MDSVHSDEDSVDAPKITETTEKEEDKAPAEATPAAEESEKEDVEDEEKQPSSKTPAATDDDDDDGDDKGTTKQPPSSVALPAIITDEEGVSIPEKGDGSNIYQYRDFSNVPEEELDQQPLAAPPPPSSRGAVEASIRVQKFPVKLYAILAQKEFSDIFGT
ncbi:MAG: hypothetical protein SGARI_002307 [Bacillariaceae sp.]